ncbi:hypothetical protein [Mucilaginibacter rubeus]|uniref:Uncharacterized protein n=1 Tax=Mucilaginibacter rubeus TaxID=2027860 RepID=A0A5C1I5G3_9SPHI|nr:hypothetical protein [Mucilaginibacter rubeus]QEM13462.1 hypothetical protein DEO27_026780 [Mucilaginibacter rubeus]
MDSNLKSIVAEYFKDFFETIRFYEDKHILAMVGTRKGNDFSYVFSDLNNASNYQFDLLHHYLENIKGEMVRSEQRIILENGK